MPTHCHPYWSDLQSLPLIIYSWAELHTFEPSSQIKDNFLSSPSHPALLKKSVSFLCCTPVIGAIPPHLRYVNTRSWTRISSWSYFFPRAACIYVQAFERDTLAWWFPGTDLWVFNVTFNLLLKELGASGGCKLKFWNIRSEILE